MMFNIIQAILTAAALLCAFYGVLFGTLLAHYEEKYRKDTLDFEVGRSAIYIAKKGEK